MSGYSGYVANNPEPNLSPCLKMDTNDKQSFSLFKRAGINDDQLTVDLDMMQSQGPGYYRLDNQYSCECGLSEAKEIQVSQPGIHLKGSYGWGGEKGCLMDADTTLRQSSDRLTNKNEIHQITERLFQTTPSLTKGFFDVDVESVIRPGNFTTDQRSCGPLSGVTLGNQFTPMIPKLKGEVQDPDHIIPEDSRRDWVRGGLPTRQMVRNKDYLRRCQEKTTTV
jgi:hypothetical protein